MACLRIEFATVRELERKIAHIFKYGGIGFGVGVILIFAFPPIGIPVTALFALAILGGIIYVSMLGKERSRPLFCPYCASKNDVYVSRREFNCDMCHRPVKIDENGQPVMAQPIDLTARHNQPSND
jgi:hypothetical protein